MVKFTLDDKINVIELYLSEKESYESIGRLLKTDGITIMEWVKRYDYHGLEAFKKSYTRYSAQFKLDVLNYMNEHGASSRKAAIIFNIPSAGNIRKWRKLYETGGMIALEPKSKGRTPMNKNHKQTTKKQVPAEGTVEALQAEIDYLRMENAYLKKLNALVQEKEVLHQKTKRK